VLTLFHSFGWVNASYVYALQIINNSHMERALGAITDWETFEKVTSGEFDLDDGRHHKEAEKTVRAAVRRASMAHAPGHRASNAGAQAVDPPTVLDAHQGPHPSSDHASG